MPYVGDQIIFNTIIGLLTVDFPMSLATALFLYCIIYIKFSLSQALALTTIIATCLRLNLNAMNILRSAKSASDWNFNELAAYHIQIEREAAQIFFHGPLASVGDYDSRLLSSASLDQLIDCPETICNFLTCAAVAGTADPNQASAIDDLAKSVLWVTGFYKPGVTHLRPQFSIPLNIRGDDKQVAQSNVCLQHIPSMMLLLVQANKTSANPSDPEAQMVAEAIAAFQFNNEVRKLEGLPELDAMTIPSMIMVGTQPAFYFVPVTKQLSNAVAFGDRPEAVTIIKSCHPPRSSFPEAKAGLENVNYRQTALQYYVSFGRAAGKHWAHMIAGF